MRTRKELKEALRDPIYSDKEQLRHDALREIEHLEAEVAASNLSWDSIALDCKRARMERDDARAELALASAKITRYEELIFSCDDCGPAEHEQRAKLAGGS